MAMSALQDPTSIATDIAKRLGISTATLCDYVNGNCSPKEKGAKLLQINHCQ